MNHHLSFTNRIACRTAEYSGATFAQALWLQPRKIIVPQALVSENLHLLPPPFPCHVHLPLNTCMSRTQHSRCINGGFVATWLETSTYWSVRFCAEREQMAWYHLCFCHCAPGTVIIVSVARTPLHKFGTPTTLHPASSWLETDTFTGACPCLDQIQGASKRTENHGGPTPFFRVSLKHAGPVFARSSSVISSFRDRGIDFHYGPSLFRLSQLLRRYCCPVFLISTQPCSTHSLSSQSELIVSMLASLRVPYIHTMTITTGKYPVALGPSSLFPSTFVLYSCTLLLIPRS